MPWLLVHMQATRIFDVILNIVNPIFLIAMNFPLAFSDSLYSSRILTCDYFSPHRHISFYNVLQINPRPSCSLSFRFFSSSSHYYSQHSLATDFSIYFPPARSVPKKLPQR